MQPGERESLKSAGSDMDRKYGVALALYAILATLAWFTLGEGVVLVGSKLGVEAASAGCDWRNGFEDGFSPSCGEDSQGRGRERRLGLLVRL